MGPLSFNKFKMVHIFMYLIKLQKIFIFICSGNTIYLNLFHVTFCFWNFLQRGNLFGVCRLLKYKICMEAPLLYFLQSIQVERIVIV